MATPGGKGMHGMGLHGVAATPPRSGAAMLAGDEEHRSPSPGSGMPSPERHQWQMAAQAVDRGMELTARHARQKRLFRSRSEAPATLAAAAAASEHATVALGSSSGGGEQNDNLADMLRVHSRAVLLPPPRDDDDMV